MSGYIKRLEDELHRAFAVAPSKSVGGDPVNFCHVREADLRSLLSDVERMRGAILTITYRDSDGSVGNSFVEDCDLRKYAPVLDEIHPPRQALSAPNTEERE